MSAAERMSRAEQTIEWALQANGWAKGPVHVSIIGCSEQSSILLSSFTFTRLAYNVDDDSHYAMKILSKKKLSKRAKMMQRAPSRDGRAGLFKPKSPLDRVYREIAILKKLDHPNVRNYFERFIASTKENQPNLIGRNQMKCTLRIYSRYIHSRYIYFDRW